MSELTNGKWNLPANASGVLHTSPPRAKVAPHHRTDDAILGATLLSVLALPIVVWQSMHPNRTKSSRTLRSFLRGNKLSAHRAK